MPHPFVVVAQIMTLRSALSAHDLSSVLRCSHATHDLFNQIAKGNYPEWKFQIQTLDPAEQLNFDFDPLDATKVCAH